MRMGLLISLFSAMVASAGLAEPPSKAVQKPPQPQKLELIRQIPHTGYSEGLDFHDGFLWHALPKEILKIDPNDGSVMDRFVPATDYSESVTWFEGKLWNLSFTDNSIHVGELRAAKPPSDGAPVPSFSFKKAGVVPEVHGWGITHNGKQIIVTGDYSAKLYFLNPKTLKIEKTVTAPVTALEDLAWDGVGIWSSSFTGYRGQIFRISPKDGKIIGHYLLPDPEMCPVIDGIAVDGSRLWITGKQCPALYLVKNPLK